MQFQLSFGLTKLAYLELYKSCGQIENLVCKDLRQPISSIFSASMISAPILSRSFLIFQVQHISVL